MLSYTACGWCAAAFWQTLHKQQSAAAGVYVDVPHTVRGDCGKWLHLKMPHIGINLCSSNSARCLQAPTWAHTLYHLLKSLLSAPHGTAQQVRPCHDGEMHLASRGLLAVCCSYNQHSIECCLPSRNNKFEPHVLCTTAATACSTQLRNRSCMLVARSTNWPSEW